MGTIISRKRADGSFAHTAQIRLKRGGQIVHSEAETFDRKPAAQEWLTRREAELQAQRARGETVGKRMTVGEMVTWYEGREREDEPWGRTKKADLARLKLGALANKRADKLTASDFIDYIDGRRNSGAGPATAGNDIIWLRQVFRSVRVKERVPVPMAALDEAAEYLREERTIGKPNRRDRRLKQPHGKFRGEEAILLEHFENRRGPIPMADIMRFALVSARREDEICRLLRSDLDPANRTALLRDVKHPKKKIGNNKTFRILDEAWTIIERQPVVKVYHADGSVTDDPRVFPYNSKSVGTAFTKAVAFLGIDDLHFHDLRHEATSRLFERGYGIHEVAQFTLHESWATLKRYTHLRPEKVPQK